MLSKYKVDKFRRDGFVKGSRVLNEQEVQLLRDELDRVIQNHGRPGAPQPILLRNLGGDDDHPVWQIVNIYEASLAFRGLIAHPAILDEVSQLSGATELRVWHDQIQYKPSSTGGVNMWHQDSPLWDILQPKTTQLTAWIALDDVDEDNGCMSMVPGSHRLGNNRDYLFSLKSFGDLPGNYRGMPIQPRLCRVKMGEVHYHHGLTWHGSHENRSGRPRRAIAVHFMTEETTYAPEGSHVMKPFVEVSAGERLRGSRFPLVWSRAA